MIKYTKQQITKLNKDLKSFPHLFPIDDTMNKTFDSVSRLVMLDRYTQKDVSHKTLGVGDVVVTILVEDPTFPTRGVGKISKLDGHFAYIEVEESYLGAAADAVDGIIKRSITQVDKPLEIYFEQIAKRVAKNLGDGEGQDIIDDIYHEISNLNIVPAGRVLFGAGSNTNVTYFNCYVMPFINDSREGISTHRQEVMEIMSRGGGVGTNGSTLRPKNSLAKGVNGRSSGSVSWLNDLSSLTHLVEQGGSRRGAQMIMLADWHPDIYEFIISKMQNPKILRFLIDTFDDEEIITLAKNKLKFTPLAQNEFEMYENIVSISEKNDELFSHAVVNEAKDLIAMGGRYSVNKPDFLTGANISVAITNEFIQAIKTDSDYELRFPDVDNFSPEIKEIYNAEWDKLGDVREWEALGHPVKVHKTIKAKDLWNLINICATYSAEPGIFFIDNANDMTNAKGYGQKVVCTNPCGEQPLAPYSVCNLAAINLANMVNRETKEVDWDKLKKSIRTSIIMQDNVIDKTNYFLETNKKQALGERRIGMGIMGLHDLLIWSGIRYGSNESNKLISKLFKFMCDNAYEASIDIAKKKGSFPFLEENGSIEEFLNSGFMLKMDESIREGVRKHGIRNSHLLTIAPTGSTGTMVGVSTGLEPYFAFEYFRSGRLGKFIKVNAKIVDDYIKLNPKTDVNNLPDIFVSAMQLTPDEHATTQCLIQEWVDSSISKTVNAPKGYTVEDVEKLYMNLYDGGAKGGTVYVDGSRDTQVLSLSKDDDVPKQVDMVIDLGMEVDQVNPKKQQDEINEFRSDRQDRNIGVEIGDLCPICNEGTVEDIGGCNTCTNCNAQLKCGL